MTDASMAVRLSMPSLCKYCAVSVASHSLTPVYTGRPAAEVNRLTCSAGALPNWGGSCGLDSDGKYSTVAAKNSGRISKFRKAKTDISIGFELGSVSSQSSSWFRGIQQGLNSGQVLGISSRAGNGQVEKLSHRSTVNVNAAAAAGKRKRQTKKRKDKEKGRDGFPAVNTGDPKHRFDWQMLVWDDVYEKLSEDSVKANRIWNIARTGLAAFGPGAVLVRELVRLVPRGTGSGFGAGAPAKQAIVRSSDVSEGGGGTPPYSATSWEAKFVPATWLKSPELSPEGADLSHVLFEGDETLPVANDVDLKSVLGNVDRTRLLTISDIPQYRLRSLEHGLSGSEGVKREEDVQNLDYDTPVTSSVNTAVDNEGGALGGGSEEDPYDPDAGELVLLLAVVVEGERRPIIGADVVRAIFQDSERLCSRQEEREAGSCSEVGDGTESKSSALTSTSDQHGNYTTDTLSSHAVVVRLETRGLSELLSR